MKRIFNSLLRHYRETFWSLEHQARKAGVNIGDNNFIALKYNTNSKSMSRSEKKQMLLNLDDKFFVTKPEMTYSNRKHT